MDIDFKQMEILKEMQKVKEKNECFVCEIVVPFNKDIHSTVYGQTDNETLIAMIKSLEMIAQDLKKHLIVSSSKVDEEHEIFLSDLLGKNRWKSI